MKHVEVFDGPPIRHVSLWWSMSRYPNRLVGLWWSMLRSPRRHVGLQWSMSRSPMGLQSGILVFDGSLIGLWWVSDNNNIFVYSILTHFSSSSPLSSSLSPLLFIFKCYFLLLPTFISSHQLFIVLLLPISIPSHHLPILLHIYSFNVLSQFPLVSTLSLVHL